MLLWPQKLPPTHNHPLWEAWDLAQDMCLTQLPNVLAGVAEFEHIPFFSDQLTAFEVWLDMQQPVPPASHRVPPSAMSSPSHSTYGDGNGDPDCNHEQAPEQVPWGQNTSCARMQLRAHVVGAARAADCAPLVM